MRVSAAPNFRFLLAATALLVLFAGAYEAAVQWPGRPPAAASQVAVLDATTDTVALAGPVMLAQQTPPPTPPAGTKEYEDLAHRDNRPVFERGNSWARRPRLLRRYVGTIGGQPATALLEWQNPDSVSGSFYLHRQGPAYYLKLPAPPDQGAPRPFHRRRGQMLEVTEQHYWGADAGEWQLHGRPGATLTGTWHGGPARRPQAVVLRENYAGGVRLAIQTWWVHGRYTITDDYGNAHSSVPEVKYELMHLPDPASVPPPLRPILSPNPANRRRLLLKGGDHDCITDQKLSVRLNDFGLFSYSYEEYCSPISGGAGERYRSALLDLRAGRWITVESQLIPHYEAYLARLLAPHLLHDGNYWHINRDSTWRQKLTRYLSARHDTVEATTRWLLANTTVSAEEGVLTGAGLEVPDWRGNYIQAFPRETFSWFIPYRELRPLVRPGTPLAQMLAARGMW